MAGSCVRSVVLRVLALVVPAAVNPWFTVATSQVQRVATAALNDVLEVQRVTVDVDNTPLVAVLHQITRQAGLVPAFDRALIPAATRVTLHVHSIPSAAAFEQALRGTGLRVAVLVKGNVAIMRNVDTVASTGTIVGRVIDSKTKLPLPRAKVGLDGTDRVTETGEDGVYRIMNVSSASHTVTVRLIGYAKVVHTVSVPENGSATLDVVLESSARPLDQVVVTGTVVAAELKSVPNAITVITAKQIAERGITRIDQLFRGDVPGLFAMNTGSANPLDGVLMFSRGATALSSNSAGVSNLLGNSNPIKTYIDGVELADPTYLSQIDAKSIERIEILTGPQASTIYGSNAINGVMQVFTKRGTSRTPQLSLNLLNGWVENDFSTALTPQHDYSGQLNGVEGRLSYNAGGSWQYVGPWTPSDQTTRAGVFGGTRLEVPTSLGRVTADATLRRSRTQNRLRGPTGYAARAYIQTGWYSSAAGSVASYFPSTSILSGQTLGLVLDYTPTNWWSHEFGIGMDASDIETRSTARGYTSVADTTLSFTQTRTARSSLRYTTSAHVSLTSLAQSTITVGADAWQNLSSAMTASPQTLTGSFTGTTSLSRQPGHNTGAFLQTQLGIVDRLFFTYGLRAEWNPDYGEAAQPNFAPRYGVAYTRDAGAVTVKLRGSYGHSTRPPSPTLKTALPADQSYGSLWVLFSPYYQNFNIRLANPDLGPEDQRGGEGGVELYVGNRGSLVITRYNQTVGGLIANVTADSARSLTPCLSPCIAYGKDKDGYGYVYQGEYLNVGSIRNQGWELQGSMNVGPFSTHGTYSWTKSRVIGVSPRYRSFFTATSFPNYQPGATFQYLPEHTWALGLTYTRSATTVALSINGVGQIKSLVDAFDYRYLSSFIRLQQNQLAMYQNGYIMLNNGYALADMTVSHRFLQRVDGVLQVKNLADRYNEDRWAAAATMGRQVQLGVRLR